jgi:hypothetical protein
MPFPSDYQCDFYDRLAIDTATALAYEIISKCVNGYCGGNGTGKRKWLNALYSGTVTCPKRVGYMSLRDEPFNGTYGGALARTRTWGGGTRYYPRVIDAFYNPAEGPECLAAVIAHERLHTLHSGSVQLSDYLYVPPIEGNLEEYTQMEEDFIDEAVYDPDHGCFNCATIAGGSMYDTRRRTGYFGP